tara:strand:+ start:788 stop:1054 length:267 start_codon:yes stop_codon:yes gene_type:complete
MARSSKELKSGFDDLLKNAFYILYRDNLVGEFNRVQQALVQNAMSDEKELRVCAALMSAFQTSLNLPDLIVKAAETEEELANADINEE